MNKTAKNVFLLATCQALFMTSTSAVMTVSALTGHMLAEDKTLATLPLALQFISGMLATIPASLYMNRVGRRIGFITGTFIGMVGAAVAAYAVFADSMELFCLGSFILGSFNGFSRYFRFAAAEAASLEFRPKAISLVLAGGVVAAFTGPNLARMTVEWFQPVVFAGTFVALIGVQISITAVLLFIDIPRADPNELKQTSRRLREIVRQPIFVVSILGATVSYVVMSFLMTITPLAMAGHHFSFSDSAFVIQSHILGMFVPAFFTGHLITRFGLLNVMLWGVALQLVCIVTNLSGTSFLHFALSMMLVGVGWNFLFVGATTLLTQACTAAEKAKTQALNEFVVSGGVAVGAFFSGVIQHSLGWSAVNLVVSPLVLVVTIAIIWLRVAQRPASA